MIKREVLNRISEKKLEYVTEDLAKELGISLHDFEESLLLLKDMRYIELEQIATRIWWVRITADGYKWLNETAKDK